MSTPMSDKELLAYSGEHVYYEVKMFFWLAIVLSKRKITVTTATPDDALWLRNTLIEGFAIHLRNLLEFIFSNYPKNKRVVAAQFCQRGKWTEMRTEKKEILKLAWSGQTSKWLTL